MPMNREGGQGTQRSGQPNQETNQKVQNQNPQRDQGGQRNKESDNQPDRSSSGQQKQ